MSERKILYVEDNEYNRKIVRQLLSRSPCRLIEAGDGETGVALARQELPDLILMDVQLPKMSGLDATRLLSTEAPTRHIPIIVITSYALSGDREKAMKAGAAAYLAKPYSPSELLAMVKQFLPGL
ncbi:response regulator [Variovorax ginsengisoli]|uniref:Response regulator n=1 Tax=Variovorax ginsengisoli TaxID=363844 RepID=A0ABT8S3I9_9BURK|nr:response regulator [Variovorax ginsengisoli]MDN8614318.1 response regulator [Variovorax ginsengisoli]MDO1533488.1 response regulator [Variovorax ginsengisoli]